MAPNVFKFISEFENEMFCDQKFWDAKASKTTKEKVINWKICKDNTTKSGDKRGAVHI